MMTGARSVGRAGRRAARVVAVVAMVPVFTFGLAGAAHADVTSVTGRAAGISANVTAPLPVALAATPVVTLPAAGSAVPITQTVATAGVPLVLDAGVLTATTQGTLGPGGSVASSASVANTRVGNLLTTLLAIGAVSSECTATEAGVTGDATVASISALGAPLVIDTSPNTTLNVAGVGILHINEQIISGTAPNQTITVNALRLEVNAVGVLAAEIVIAQSVCGVTGTGVVVPTGAVGGVLLTGLVAVAFGASQIRRHRRGSGPAPA
jgi:hypothetical protein